VGRRHPGRCGTRIAGAARATNGTLAGGMKRGVGGEQARNFVLDELHDGFGGFRQTGATTDRAQRNLQKTYSNKY
jgi:hypothetical protein